MKKNNKVLTQCALRFDDHVGDKMDLEPNEINEIIETLCYKHITLVLLPNPNGERDIFIIEVDLLFTKSHKRNYK